MPDQMDPVAAAVARLDEDLALINSVPVAPTQAGRQQVQATQLAAHERFAASVRAAVGVEAEPRP